MRKETKSGIQIRWESSPHFWKAADPRVEPITLVVIHYTGSPEKSLDGDIAWLKDPQSKVSYHYMIGYDGEIVNLVKESDRAWHAGVSSWDEKKSCNKFSIGIALDGSKDTKWSEVQLDSLAALCVDIRNEYGLDWDDFVGHSDVSPGRKIDPGSNFDWQEFRRRMRKIIEGKEEDKIASEVTQPKYSISLPEFHKQALKFAASKANCYPDCRCKCHET